MGELVSVVIPTFKRSVMLERALRSVLSQDYGSFEVIVVDDNGSESSDSEFVTGVVASIGDDRVRVVRNKENLGGAEARNEGIRASCGEFVAFLDDDDAYEQGKLSISMRPFGEDEDARIAVVYGWATSVYDDGTTFVNDGVYEGCCIDKLLETRCIAATSQWVCRKSALLKVGGFTKTPAKQDSILMLKLLSAGYEVACIRQSLSLYYEHSGGRISGTHKTIEGERLLQEMGRKVYDRLDDETIERIEYAYEARLSVLYFEDGNYEEFRKHASRARSYVHASMFNDVYVPVIRLAKAKVAKKFTR